MRMVRERERHIFSSMATLVYQSVDFLPFSLWLQKASHFHNRDLVPGRAVQISNHFFNEPGSFLRRVVTAWN